MFIYIIYINVYNIYKYKYKYIYINKYITTYLCMCLFYGCTYV